MLKIIILSFGMVGLLYADSKPSWYGKDYRSPIEWGFFCSATAKTEDEALKMASAQCAHKICLLFGVEVETETVTSETLKDVSVKSTVIEKCPKVRVVGRKQKRKLVSCEEDSCVAYLFHVYPKREYLKEYKRLNQPKISRVFEKTIIIREGKETFRDPAKCRKELTAYSVIRGERPQDSRERIKYLKAAAKECKNLDYRNFNLQNELRNYLIMPSQYRNISAATYLNQIFQKDSKLEKQIEGFLDYEQGLFRSAKQIPRLKKLLKQSHDALFSRDNYHGEKGIWILYNGKTSRTNPYLDELKTCRKMSNLLKAWPRNVTQNLTTCLPRVNGKGEDCQTTNITMLRAQFAGCVCRIGAMSKKQDCSRVLFQAFDEKCLGEINTKCYQASLSQVKKNLSISIKTKLPK